MTTTSSADPATNKAPAISRAVAILRLLGRSNAPMGVQAIARELGLVPSTCLYVLRALAAEELVAFDPDTKRYSLEAGILTLARQWLRGSQFADLAQPVLDKIGRTFDVSMLGVQIFGLEHIIVVALSRSDQAMQLSAQIGSRFPALISATGRCIAAYGDYSHAELEKRYATLRWNQAPSFDQWIREVEETRVRGFAVDGGNYIAGATVVSTPVWKAPGRPSHALVATRLGNADKRDDMEALSEAMLAGARTLTQQLGGEQLQG